MSSVSMANILVEEIVGKSKKMIKDRLISKQKVPLYVESNTQNINQESLIQGGNQVDKSMRNNYFSMIQEQQPFTSVKESLGSTRPKIQRSIKSMAFSSANKTKRSNSLNGFNKRYKNDFEEVNNREKENKFIKIQEKNSKKIVVNRVLIRESAEEERMRSEKQAKFLKAILQKKNHQLKEKEKRQEQEQKSKSFREHTSKGKDHKFYFHQGELVLFKEQTVSSPKGPPQTPFHLPTDQQENDLPHQCNQFFKRTPYESENHRIKSARGEVFASAVLKTINLSRISVNGTLRNLEDQQFMTRNDLFNNNHSRQTTSIPYLHPKTGTVYTQISTNQVIHQSKKEDKHPSYRSQASRKNLSNHRKTKFEPYLNHQLNLSDMGSENNEKELISVRTRPIRTTEGIISRPSSTGDRPLSTTHRGRITRANENLTMVLLK